MKNPWQEITKPESDVNVMLVGDEHPVELYWGKDTQGRYLFIFKTEKEHAPEKKNLPKLSGISALVARSDLDAKVILILNETTNWEIFHALCMDLARATSAVNDAKEACAIILRRLERWQELLKRERSGILPPEQIKGLLGELLFLIEKTEPAFGWDDSITFWKGPEEAPQDFAIHDTAIEIKCQSGGSKPSVKITSVEQLEPQLPKGYLAVYTLASADKDDADGFNLNEVIDRIRDAIEGEAQSTRERFEDLIYMAGYTWSEEYERYRFSKVALHCYSIEGEFPRVRMSELSPGIERLTYTLKLESCAPFKGTPEWWRDNNEN